MNGDRWDRHFLRLAREVSRMIKDPSTQVGAVIVRADRTIASTGFNGFPRGCSDDPRLYADREQKLARTVHAELNAILFADGIPEGATLYVWPLPVCDRCMAAVIQTEICRVVSPPAPESAVRWVEAFDRAEDMADEAGVLVETVEVDDE